MSRVLHTYDIAIQNKHKQFTVIVVDNYIQKVDGKKLIKGTLKKQSVTIVREGKINWIVEQGVQGTTYPRELIQCSE